MTTPPWPKLSRRHRIPNRVIRLLGVAGDSGIPLVALCDRAMPPLPRYASQRFREARHENFIKAISRMRPLLRDQGWSIVVTPRCGPDRTAYLKPIEGGESP